MRTFVYFVTDFFRSIVARRKENTFKKRKETKRLKTEKREQIKNRKETKRLKTEKREQIKTEKKKRD